MSVSVQSCGAELALILLAIKLVMCRSEDNANESVYSLEEGFLNSLQYSGLMSFMRLKTSILIAFFEYGHSIYPVAWMTVGSCAQCAELLKISSSSGTSFLWRLHVNQRLRICFLQQITRWLIRNKELGLRLKI
ncbi:hypothetical protein LY78DRAFT_659599 [Colletotrichum sublineola]|nr:hypothetical protein LY78DRAFT_659599 [Colletotrichum sublineola]